MGQGVYGHKNSPQNILESEYMHRHELCCIGDPQQKQNAAVVVMVSVVTKDMF
jgi:hypothetical protein